MIFNDFWVGICDGDNQATKLNDANELMIWNMKNNKSYALISEEVNHHISSIDDPWNTLKKLKDLYESHSEL